MTNLFMVYSPLHCLCAELIATHFEAGARNIAFHLRPEFRDCLNKELWHDIEYHPWPRFFPESGPFGRTRRTLKNLELAGRHCAGADHIRLHTPVIDTEAINYHINFLRKRFPHARFSVRILPDGALNLKRHPQGYVRELLQWFRLLRTLTAPSLKFYRFKGDRTGSDDPIVDRIYTLPSFPHEYERAKTVELPPLIQNETVNGKQNIMRRALVIGQPLIAYKFMTRESVDSVTRTIYEYLMANGIQEIHYKSHPRDKTREYALDEYQELKIQEPLEQHMSHFPYGIVIGVCSTALLTGRMILPDWCKVVACGMNVLRFKDHEEREYYTQTFQQLGVEIIEASTSN